MTTPQSSLQRGVSVEDNGLGQSHEFSQELAPTAAAESARQEIQAAVILAKRFPRNEDQAYAGILKSCKRPTFASDVEYAFPRGGSTVKGPSIYLAREFARLWGNIRHGCDVIADSEDERTIRAWAWDLETNVKVTADASFKKLIYRKQGSWQKPDERDLRELTNKHAALAKRNCLLELLPSDMVEDACDQARKTLNNKAAEDPDALRKTLIKSFAELNVPIASLESYLTHPLGESSPEELVNLRAIYKSIKDGNSKWAEYINGGNGAAEDLKNKTQANADALKEKLAANGKAETPSEPAAENATDVEPETVTETELSIKDQVSQSVFLLQKEHGVKDAELKVLLPDGVKKFSDLSEEQAVDVLPSVQQLLESKQAG